MVCPSVPVAWSQRGGGTTFTRPLDFSVSHILLTGAEHFAANKVTLFDSLGVRPTKKLREQILQLFSVDGRVPEVKMPKLQKQAYG